MAKSIAASPVLPIRMLQKSVVSTALFHHCSSYQGSSCVSESPEALLAHTYTPTRTRLRTHKARARGRTRNKVLSAESSFRLQPPYTKSGFLIHLSFYFPFECTEVFIADTSSTTDLGRPKARSPWNTPLFSLSLLGNATKLVCCYLVGRNITTGMSFSLNLFPSL
jgi:hypothetical protein